MIFVIFFAGYLFVIANKEKQIILSGLGSYMGGVIASLAFFFAINEYNKNKTFHAKCKVRKLYKDLILKIKNEITSDITLLSFAVVELNEMAEKTYSGYIDIDKRELETLSRTLSETYKKYYKINSEIDSIYGDVTFYNKGVASYYKDEVAKATEVIENVIRVSEIYIGFTIAIEGAFVFKPELAERQLKMVKGSLEKEIGKNFIIDFCSKNKSIKCFDYQDIEELQKIKDLFFSFEKYKEVNI
ncbi:hypothetical protein [Pseudoalteromonas sp. T1lg76]|uniref:hypothetical protein n=1 Tax=Pseudoalteromonas sp. T1lg76 TaxID=2077103 RepID=UPI000CF63818|nr:hypothetical protein [Pseudoalteromonas sp. T1lg76]